jgi:hypothetical protein
VNLAATVDMTGSSGPFALGVRLTLATMFDEITKHSRSLKVWLAVHGDHDCCQEELLLSDGVTAAQALADLESVRFWGGNDAAEHHATAIERLFERTNWERDARKVIVALTTDDTKPAHSGRTLEQIGQLLHDAGVLFCLVGNRNPELTKLVQAAKGYSFELSNTPQLDELKHVGRLLGASISRTLTTHTATRPAPPPTRTRIGA